MSKHEREENFRDHVGNQTADGKREWIYPKIIKGKLYKYRTYFSWFLLAFFFAGPFIKIGKYPLLLLNFIERKFVIFGQPFWPQDFFVFVILTLTFLVFIVVFTVVFGRVWCGWACPQTIFMEMVFRKIENLIEGNANKQKKLYAMPWNREKIFKKSLKHTVFFAVSFAISHTFLAYIIGYEQLWAQITGPFAENYVTFLSLVLFSFVFYLVFAKMRELVCIMACPYGRLQGVMLDQNSMVIAYDYLRGEPRGKIRKNEEQEKKGDCVDCGLCVDVCPTGIDIRHGTQLECINCTGCMDACDEVMVKINKPVGLIRIDSKNNIEEKKGFKISTRIIAYSAVMLILLGSSVAILATRKSVEANVLRISGSTYSESADGRVTNMFNLSMVNKTFEDKNFRLELESSKNTANTTLIMVQQDSVLKSNSEEKKVFMIYKEQKDINKNEVPMEVNLFVDGELIKTSKFTFLAPVRE
jgi:cytochrome c oxidase accessory protein FixG